MNNEQTAKHRQPLTEQEPQISVAVIIGRQRQRAQEMVDALCSQTARDRIEVLLGDFNPEMSSPEWPPEVPIRRIPLSIQQGWGGARAELVRQARTPVVAFVEEHAPPEKDWAEYVIEAHRGPWVAVAYAVKNGSPDTFLHRAIWMAEYGFWAHPARDGPVTLMPGNNIAYKREALLAFGESLHELMTADFNVLEKLQQQRQAFYQSAGAIVAHQSTDDVVGLLRANVWYGRLLAANRVRTQGWSLLRRLCYGAAIPVLLPTLRLLRLARYLTGRPTLWALYAATLPLSFVIYSSAAFGESIGYLQGQGRTPMAFTDWEVQANRDTA